MDACSLTQWTGHDVLTDWLATWATYIIVVSVDAALTSAGVKLNRDSVQRLCNLVGVLYPASY